MSAIPQNIILHLRYRLWIAEMNADINVLRILEDCLKEFKDRKDLELNIIVDNLYGLFLSLRKEIDELRNEMHILKMKLATYLREGQPATYKTYIADRHIAIKKHYSVFKKMFARAKFDFKDFEEKYMQLV